MGLGLGEVGLVSFGFYGGGFWKLGTVGIARGRRGCGRRGGGGFLGRRLGLGRCLGGYFFED